MSLNDLMSRLLGLPELASKEGADVDKLIFYVHYLMAILFIGWSAYFIYCLIRFRKGRHPKANYHGVRSHASTYVEVAVAVFEGVLLLGFAIPLWAKTVEEFPPDKDSTVIRVTAQQFAWNSRYPGKDGVFGKQDIALVSPNNKFGYDTNDPAYADDVVPPINDIAVPVNKPVVIKLTSLDVIHSFKLYSMRVNQDAIPGLMVPVHFTPTRVGRFQITCAQLCGNSHYAMRGFFTVMKPEDYQAWLASKSKAGGSGAASFE